MVQLRCDVVLLCEPERREEELVWRILERLDSCSLQGEIEDGQQELLQSQSTEVAAFRNNYCCCNFT